MSSTVTVHHTDTVCPPVLFLVFNRPDLTRRVFQRIRLARPTKLFVAADGPRASHPGEDWLCAQTRKIVAQVDWDCEVQTLFREHNLGCGRAVSSAITWFFEHVEAGIILEDDCLPDLSFFPFCGELLEKYRFDESVFEISGDNFLRGSSTSAGISYTFSIFSLIWGWATWRRAWQHYDYLMLGWSQRDIRRKIRKYVGSREIYARWEKIFDSTSSGRIDTWDSRWTYSCWLNQGLCIHPKVNLVSNIGFDERATHTFGRDHPSAAVPTKPISFPLTHPERIERNTDFDQYLLHMHFALRQKPLSPIKSLVKEILPPVLYRLLAETYWKLKSLRNYVAHQPTGNLSNSPKWHVVSGGVLSGLHLFVASEMPTFREMVDGLYDQHFWTHLSTLNLIGRTVIDIGGHIGYHSLGFSRLVGQSGHVHVFEPNPHNVERMHVNFSANHESTRNISIHQYALSDRNGFVDFNVSSRVDDQTSSGSFIEGSNLPLSETIYAEAGFFTISTPTVTLDKFVTDNEIVEVSLIKIDVEGAEKLVLRGATETIRQLRPTILLEVHSPSAMVDICVHFASLSYKLDLVDHDGTHRFFIVASPN